MRLGIKSRFDCGGLGMHEAILAAAFRPDKVSVLGLELADYGIGHELGLWRRGNPLVNGRPEQVLAEAEKWPVRTQLEVLTSAVLVCCEEDPPAEWAEKQAKRAKKLNVPAELKRFMDYLSAAGADLPTVKIPRRANEGPVHYYGAPEMAMLINYLSAHHGMLIAAHYGGSPLAVPLGLARILYTTHLEAQGAVWVENWYDVRDRARLKAFEAQNPEGVALGPDAVREMAERWNREHPEHPVPVS